MRDRIKVIGVELLMRDGYRGLRFADIAEALGITRANVHYHFGTKQRLVEEIFEDYLRDTLTRVRSIWTDEEASLEDKLRATMEFNRERYRKFNTRGPGTKPWSLIARMRLERNLLSPRTNNHMRKFVEELESLVTAAIELAKKKGELAQNAPVQDIAVQLAFIMNSANSITQDHGNFDGLEQLYLAVARVIKHAYGRKSSPTAVRRRPRVVNAV